MVLTAICKFSKSNGLTRYTINLTTLRAVDIVLFEVELIAMVVVSRTEEGLVVRFWLE